MSAADWNKKEVDCEELRRRRVIFDEASMIIKSSGMTLKDITRDTKICSTVLSNLKNINVHRVSYKTARSALSKLKKHFDK